MMPDGPQLADIHLPAAPSWWPPAPGWWLVAVLVTGAGIVMFLGWRRRIRLRRLRRMLEIQFETALALTQAPGDEARQVAALSMLLRRAAVRFTPHSATLKGEDWLAFLDAGDPAQPFSRGAGRLLLEGPYRAQVSAEDARALAVLVGPRLLAFVDARHA